MAITRTNMPLSRCSPFHETLATNFFQIKKILIVVFAQIAMNLRFIALIVLYAFGVPVVAALLLLLAPLDRALFGDMHFLCIRVFSVCPADFITTQHLAYNHRHHKSTSKHRDTPHHAQKFTETKVQLLHLHLNCRRSRLFALSLAAPEVPDAHHAGHRHQRGLGRTRGLRGHGI